MNTKTFVASLLLLALAPAVSLAVSFKLVSVNSGKVLDVREGSDADGAVIQQYEDNGGLQQLWEFVPAPSGIGFAIRSRVSNKVLDVAGQSLQDGAVVQQWTYHGGDNQHWLLEDAGDGNVRIVNVGSGKVLDVVDFALHDGAGIHQWTYHGGANQLWRLILTE